MGLKHSADGSVLCGVRSVGSVLTAELHSVALRHFGSAAVYKHQDGTRL